MSEKLYGPLDDIYALARGPEARGQSDSLFGARDPELLERLLDRFLDDPVHAAGFRALLGESLDSDGDRDALRRELASRIARGDIVLRYLRDARNDQQLPGVTISGDGEIIDVEGSAVAPEQKEVDWKIQCSHHPSKRPLFERGDFLQVVPSKGSLTDKITVHYKNEHKPPPPSLRALGREWPKTGSDAGYDTYDIEVAYEIGREIKTFILPSFWSNWESKTTYSIYDGPTLMHVEVFNPRQYKLRFALPPFKSFKGGYRLEKELSRKEGGGLAVAEDYELNFREDAINESGWTPSNLTIEKVVHREEGDARGELESRRIYPAPMESIKFYIDGSEVHLDVLKLIATILNGATQISDIVEKIMDNAPKVGWYITLNYQLMQGGLVIEWYWKEHSDHRVFRYFDVRAQLTVFKITFELGVGISGLGFRAQIFAQLLGEVKVEVSVCRDDPDAAPGLAIPSTAKITGALGARFEAGNLFKAEGKGETAIEMKVEFGINKRAGKAFHLDIASTRWTGITVKATVCGGFIWKRQRTWTRTIVGERHLGGFRFPEPREYQPPTLSRRAIKDKMRAVITKGWNVHVTREVEGWFNDVSWTSDEIAQALADRVDEHTTWKRTPRMVEGLAHAIRGDLDRLGRKLTEPVFLAYLRGPEIQAHLDAIIDPARHMAERAS